MNPEKTNGQTMQTRDLAHDQRGKTPDAKSSLWWLWLIIILIAVGAGGWFGYQYYTHSGANSSAATQPAAGGKGGKAGKGGGPVPVVVAKAKNGSLDVYLNGLGTVTALNTTSIHSRVDGQLMKVYYKEGQMVKKDGLLCTLDDSPFQAMLTEANGQLMRDQALLGDAEVNLERYKDLAKPPNLSITQAQVDTQQALVNQYKGAVETDKGLIEADNVNLAYCQIKSPISGRVGLRLVDEGNIVHATDVNPLVIVTQVQPITVIFTIAEDDIRKVTSKLDPKNPMPVEAWNRDLTTKLAVGKFLALDNQVDPTTGTLKIRAIFDNTNNELFPQEFVNARLLVNTLHDVLLIPSAAVQRGPEGTFVYLMNKEEPPADAPPEQKKGLSGSIEIRPITMGATEGEQTVIESGLAPGDIVVTDGVDKLEKGTKVRVSERAGKGKKGAATQPGSTQPSATQPGGAAMLAPGATTRPSGGHSKHAKQEGAE